MSGNQSRPHPPDHLKLEKMTYCRQMEGLSKKNMGLPIPPAKTSVIVYSSYSNLAKEAKTALLQRPSGCQLLENFASSSPALSFFVIKTAICCGISPREEYVHPAVLKTNQSNK